MPTPESILKDPFGYAARGRMMRERGEGMGCTSKKTHEFEKALEPPQVVVDNSGGMIED